MKQLQDNKTLLKIKNTLNTSKNRELSQEELNKYTNELKTLFCSEENKDIEDIYSFFKANPNKKQRILFLIEIIKKYTLDQAKAKLTNLERQEKLIMLLDKEWVTNKKYLIIIKQISLLRKYINNKPFPYTKSKSNFIYKSKKYSKKETSATKETPKHKEDNSFIGELNKMKIFDNIFGSGSILYIKRKN